MKITKKILACDVGSKTVGIAKTDALQILTTPLPTIRFLENSLKSAVKQLAEIIIKDSYNVIIIGLPKNMDGSEGEAAIRSRKFAQSLLARVPNIEIVFIDERLTSQQANRILLENNYSRQKRKEFSDSVAAQLILESYIQSLKF